MLRQHVDTGADVTVGCLEVPRMEATGFGVMHVDDRRTASSISSRSRRTRRACPDKPDMALASMGIYVFETRFLIDQLRRDAATAGSSRDFGKDIIPYIVKNGKAWAHRFAALLRALEQRGESPTGATSAPSTPTGRPTSTSPTSSPQLDLYDRDWPIWTYAEITPPAKFVHDFDGRRGSAVNSLVSGDCIISGGALDAALLSTGVRVHSYSELDEAVVLPYCTHRARRAAEEGRGRPRRAHPRGPGGRRGPGARRPVVPPHRRRRDCLITQPMIDRPGSC